MNGSNIGIGNNGNSGNHYGGFGGIGIDNEDDTDDENEYQDEKLCQLRDQALSLLEEVNTCMQMGQTSDIDQGKRLMQVCEKINKGAQKDNDKNKEKHLNELDQLKQDIEDANNEDEQTNNDPNEKRRMKEMK